MDRADIRHHADLWQRNIAKKRDLTGHIESHFEHSPLMTRTQTQDREGQPNLVIEITGTFQRAITRAEHFRHHFLCSGFTHAARDTDHAQVQLATPVARDLLQGGNGVFHPQTHRRAQFVAWKGINGQHRAQVEGPERAVHIALD